MLMHVQKAMLPMAFEIQTPHAGLDATTPRSRRMHDGVHAGYKACALQFPLAGRR
jgi:hypothetical protein